MPNHNSERASAPENNFDHNPLGAPDLVTTIGS